MRQILPDKSDQGLGLIVNNIEKDRILMVIDSYCEKILGKQSSDVVSILPGGVSREEYVWKLDIFIKEMYAELTGFSEQEYRCGKALLCLIKKYCFSRKATGNLQMEKDFSDYFFATEKMLNEEIERIKPLDDGAFPVIDAEKTFTIIANSMQLLTSVIHIRNKEKEKMNAQLLGVYLPFKVDKQVKLVLSREDTSIENIVPYLDQVHEISVNFEKAKQNSGGSKTAFVEWLEFRYLKQILELTKCKLDEIGVF